MLPVLTFGVLPVPSYQLITQAPFCAPVPTGSVEVFAMAMPVSNPDTLVTNGKSNRVWQILMTRTFLAVEVSATRGMVKLAEAADPALALNGTGGVGAKLAFTVAVPAGGRLLPGFAV